MSNKKIDLQFTKLTPDDINVHEDIYINILVGLTHIQFNTYWHIYRKYAIKETLKAKQVFQKTFG